MIRRKKFHLTIDEAFPRVIAQCAQSRLEKDEGTWILQEMIEAFCKLHEYGFAHSVEAWFQGELAGGLYGVSLGRSFFGESMFTKVSNASKVALVALVDYLKSESFQLIDCQVPTPHLIRLGAREVPRRRFLKELKRSLAFKTLRGRWSLSP
jgi:leucyl/phenylalanyl-tRNA--protein transferase